MLTNTTTMQEVVSNFVDMGGASMFTPEERKEHAKVRDRMKKQKRRANEEYRALERERNAEAMRRKRRNLEWRQYEQAKNTIAKRLRREDPIEREKERIRNAEAMRIRRMDVAMREKERVKNAEYMRKRRQNEEFRKLERQRDMISKRMRRANVGNQSMKRQTMEQYIKMSMQLFQMYMNQMKNVDSDAVLNESAETDNSTGTNIEVEQSGDVLPFSANFEQIQLMLPHIQGISPNEMATASNNTSSANTSQGSFPYQSDLFQAVYKNAGCDNEIVPIKLEPSGSGNSLLDCSSPGNTTSGNSYIDLFAAEIKQELLEVEIHEK